MKVCYNSVSTPDYCQNVYDLVGCSYNMPSNVQNGTFTSCDGDLQDPVGIYVVGGVSKYLSFFFVFLLFWGGCVVYLFINLFLFFCVASTWSMLQR